MNKGELGCVTCARRPRCRSGGDQFLEQDYITVFVKRLVVATLLHFIIGNVVIVIGLIAPPKFHRSAVNRSNGKLQEDRLAACEATGAFIYLRQRANLSS